MWLGLKEVHYCECIGRDIGCGCRGEDVMLLGLGFKTCLGHAVVYLLVSSLSRWG